MTTTPRGGRRTARRTARRTTAVALVGLVLLATLLPYVVRPTSRPWLAVVIATTELSPVIAVLALVLGLVALALGRGSRWLQLGLGLATLAAVALAAVPSLGARRVAADGLRQIEALVPGSDAGGSIALPLFASALAIPAAPSTVVTRTISTLAADGTPLAYRLSRDTAASRAGATPAPVVVVVYGGAWHSGAATSDETTNRHIAGLGYTVLAVDYRHAPRHRWPSQIDDVRRSLAMLRDSAASWGADTGRVALWGRSSGGHLAALAAWGSGTDAPPVHVRGLVDYYGPFDLIEGYRDLPNPDPLDVRAILRDFLGGTPEQRPAEFRAASPATYVRAGLPPALLVYARRDHVVKARFGREAAAALRAAGVGVVFVELPWAEHAFDAAGAGPDAGAGLVVVERFLAVVLRR